MACVSDIFCQTECLKIEINYFWKIKGFSHLSGGGTRSTTFGSPIDPDKTTWNLEIKPCRRMNDGKDYVDFCLELDTKPQNNIRVNIMLSVLNRKGNVLKTVSKSDITFGPLRLFRSATFDSFLKREELLSNAQLHLPNNELTVRCKMTYNRICTKDELSAKHFTTKELLAWKQVNIGAALLLGDEEFSDMTLLVKGKEFKVHKSVLAVNSSVFKAMFSHDMKEKEQNLVEIEDLESEVFQEMLTCIYTGKAPSKLKELAKELLVASDKYMLEPLKTMAEEALIENMFVQEAADLLILADVHSAKILKERSTDFILSHLKEVKGTAGWTNLVRNHATLCANAFDAVPGVIVIRADI